MKFQLKVLRFNRNSVTTVNMNGILLFGLNNEYDYF